MAHDTSSVPLLPGQGAPLISTSVPLLVPNVRAQLNDDETQAALCGLEFRPVDVTLRDTFDDFLKMGYCARGGKAKSQWGGLNCRRDELPARSRSSSAAPLAAEVTVH